MPFNGNDYQYAFSFYEEFGYILFLIPVFLFLLNWMYISRIYKAFRWMLISFITIICLSFVVNSFTKLDTSLPNRIYQKKFESELTHIEKELNRIKTEYHLEFDHKTIQQLKNIKSNEHKELAYQIKEVMLKKEANVKDIFLAKMYVDLNQIYFEPRFSEHQKAYGYSILKPSETWGLMSTYDQNSQEYNELLLLMESLFLNSISERVNDTNDHYEMIRRKESFKAISQIHFYELKDSIPFTGTTLEQLKTLPEPSF